MNQYLVFRLYGTLTSWGEIAVGEVRPSAAYPSKSAIFGLIAAACGIRRNETGRLTALFTSYDVAVKVLSFGTLLKDYHTVQAPDNTGKFSYATRRDEIVIGKERLGTMLTTREYRCDALSIVSLRPSNGPPFTLDELRKKLKKPEFVLYLGRKSCPLSVPLHPHVITAGGFRESLDKVSFPPLIVSSKEKDLTGWYIPFSTPTYFWEGEAGDMMPHQTSERYDDPGNKTRRQFAPRMENRMTAEGGQ